MLKSRGTSSSDEIIPNLVTDASELNTNVEKECSWVEQDLENLLVMYPVVGKKVSSILSKDQLQVKCR